MDEARSKHGPVAAAAAKRGGLKSLTLEEQTNLRIYSATMLLSGIISVILCPLGKSKKSDGVHFVTAGLYMVYHIPMMSLLNMPWWPYRSGFYAGLVALGLAMKHLRRLHDKAGVPNDAEEEVKDAALEQAPKELQREVHRTKAAIMVAEYGLFVAFVSGMAAGITRNNVARLSPEASAQRIHPSS